VHAFPEEDGLKQFREWVESPDPSILENFELGLKKKSSKECKDGEPPTTNHEDVKETFMDKHVSIKSNELFL
jgi:DNA excision repair protein ERCC-5